VKSVSERADPETWTCLIETVGGRLPDLSALSRVIQEVGRPYSVRGVEARVRGRLSQTGGKLILRLSDTQDVLRVAPLRQKVQWNPRTKVSFPPTPDESEAYNNLIARWNHRHDEIEIIGPLAKYHGQPLEIEVRQVIWKH